MPHSGERLMPERLCTNKRWLLKKLPLFPDRVTAYQAQHLRELRDLGFAKIEDNRYVRTAKGELAIHGRTD